MTVKIDKATKINLRMVTTPPLHSICGPVMARVFSVKSKTKYMSGKIKTQPLTNLSLTNKKDCVTKIVDAKIMAYPKSQIRKALVQCDSLKNNNNGIE